MTLGDFGHFCVCQTIVSCISHHQTEPLFATGGEICQIWEETRSEPIRTFTWGVDSLHDITYNPIETHVLGEFLKKNINHNVNKETINAKSLLSASCASDRSIILYDSRDTGPIRRLVMKLRVNKLCWNPMEAFNFTCASEDYK